MRRTRYTHLIIVTIAILAQAASPSQSVAVEYKTRLTASDPASWKPVKYQAVSPVGGVTLDGDGLFKPVMENNIGYLLNSFSVDHMLVPFRDRAGKPNPPQEKPQVNIWDTNLRGSSAGRFLMGAGNTLRWSENVELRNRLDALIDGIEACREPNGYILPYHPKAMRSEEPNYARAWLVHGLIEAAIAGNPKAYGLLRRHADWFNQWDMLPQLINCCPNAHQGHIASTRTYFTPVGKPEDLQMAEKFYVQDWWMDQLATRRPEAVWKYPLHDPHSYLITSFEAYLDHYRATGDKKFLDAMLGAWDVFYQNWLHIGGATAIVEGGGGPVSPPGSYWIKPEPWSAETCGSVFWIKFNQRLHQLFPTEERYVHEIERSIYNVLLANQDQTKGIRYHAIFEGVKEAATCMNSCCEGQGARLYGSLPEYIYSTAADGLYVNLYEPSTIRCQLAGKPVGLAMKGKFPFDPNVTIKVSVPQPAAMKLRVRVPAWAATDMSIKVNGQQLAIGKPATYAVLDRTWSDGDTVEFTLPMRFRATRYTGVDQLAGRHRYGIEYGPILMAVTGPLDKDFCVSIPHNPQDIATWLKPMAGRPLCFAIEADAEHYLMPYWQLDSQKFCAFPVIGSNAAAK